LLLLLFLWRPLLVVVADGSPLTVPQALGEASQGDDLDLRVSSLRCSVRREEGGVGDVLAVAVEVEEHLYEEVPHRAFGQLEGLEPRSVDGEKASPEGLGVGELAEKDEAHDVPFGQRFELEGERPEP
jgi:hypothetical protein